jgi:DNA-binding transcriptional regulator GbsR (MarR family)
MPSADSAQPAGIAEAQEHFVSAWGRMAGVWGISRTMAEVHALLYITGDAMNTDDIMDRLEISRGNASMSVRALLDWGMIAERTSAATARSTSRPSRTSGHLPLDRPRAVKREVEPLLASLHEIRDQLPAPDDAEGDAQKALLAHQGRLDEMLSFFRTVEKLSQRFAGPSGSGLEAAAKLLGRLP